MMMNMSTWKVKDATAKTNIDILLNILKAYYANVHQDKKTPTQTQTESIDRLLVVGLVD